ncbi:MAG: hypothetical protein LBR11_08580 [Deltaproteobacteria bacterium]|nr:hypothetical protein [Deltaproteobacteria bacterium]
MKLDLAVNLDLSQKRSQIAPEPTNFLTIQTRPSDSTFKLDLQTRPSDLRPAASGDGRGQASKIGDQARGD